MDSMTDTLIGIAQRPQAINNPAMTPVTTTTGASSHGLPMASAVASDAQSAQIQASGRMRAFAPKGVGLSARLTQSAPSAAAIPVVKPPPRPKAIATTKTPTATAKPLRICWPKKYLSNFDRGATRNKRVTPLDRSSDGGRAGRTT